MWIKTTRITLLVALLLAVAVLAYLAAHPSLYADHVGRLISRNLRDTGISFACRDLSGNPLGSLRFHQVSMTRPGPDGSFSYLTCDSLDVAYDLGRLLRREVTVQDLVLYRPRLAVRQASPLEVAAPPTESAGPPPLDWRVDRVGVRGGSFQISTPQGDVVEEVDDLDLDATVAVEDGRLTGQVASLRARIPSRDLRIERLQASLTWDEGILEWNDAVVHLDSTRVRGSGRVGPDVLEFDADVDHAELQEVLRALDLPEGPPLWFAGRVEGNREEDGLRLEAAGRGQLDVAPLRADRFLAHVDAERLRFDQMEGMFQGATGSATGDLRFSDNRLRLQGTAAGADLSRPWTGEDRGWPRSDLAGDFALELWPEDPKRFAMTITGARGSLHDTPVDSAGVELTWSEAAGLDVVRSRVRGMGTVVQLHGTLDPDQTLEMVVRARAANLDPWAARYGIDAEGRDLQVLGRLYGPLEDASLRLGGDLGRLAGHGFEGRDNRVVVEMQGLHRDGSISGQLVTDELRAGERVLGSLSVDLARDGERIRVEQLELAHGDTTLVVDGAVRPFEEGVNLELDELQLRVDRHTWTLEAPATVHLGARRYGSSALALRSPTGSLAVEGSVDLDGPLDLDVSIQDGDLGLLAWAGLVPDVEGIADARLTMSGSADHPDLALDLDVVAPRYLDRAADSLRVVIRARDNALDLQELEVVSAQGRAAGRGVAVLPQADWLARLLEDEGAVAAMWRGTRVDGELELSAVQLDTWLAQPPANESYGAASGRFTIQGPTLDPQIAGRLSLDGFRNQVVSLPRVEVEVRGAGDRVELADGWILAPTPWIRFSGSLPLSVTAASVPEWDDSAGVDFTLETPGETDLRPLGILLPFFSRVEGTAEMRFHAQGPWASPALDGFVRVDDGVVQARDMLEEFRDVRVRGTFEDGVLRVGEVTAREGEKGRITAHGEVGFLGVKPDDVWFDFDAHRVLITSVPFLRAIGTGEGLQLRLVRPRPDLRRVPKVTGDVRVDLARYTGEFVEPGATGDGAVLDATATPPWMAELRIRAEDQVRISNSITEVRVQGDVDLIRDLAGLRLRGQVEVPQGRVRVGYLDFDITRGRLDFSRGTNLEPEIDITAETEVPVRGGSGIGRELERVTVVVTGTFQEPSFRFQSESGYDEKTIVNLLAGVPPEGQEGVALQDVSVHIAGNLLEDALADQLGVIDTVDISTQEAGLEEIGSARIGVGKYLGNNLYLRFSSGLSIQERDLFLEYQISRRVLLTSELRRRLRENAAQTQFNVDLKFRLEY